MPPRQITILGVGLLGGSLGLAIKDIAPQCRRIGWGPAKDSLERAKQRGAIDEFFTDPGAAVAGSDWVVLCTPVGSFETVLRGISAGLVKGCIVTDVGSTKRTAAALAEKILPAGVDYVPSHPMAGSEKRGVEHARVDLFRNAVCIVTPTPQTRIAAVEQVEKFWQSLGMRTVRMDAAAHDRAAAMVSHLPHLLAAALVAMQDDSAIPLAGRGFADATRMAAGDAGLWRDILCDNSDNVLEGIARLEAELARVKEWLKAGNAEAIRTWLDGAAKRKSANSEESRG